MAVTGGYETAEVDTSSLAARERFDQWREHVRTNHGDVELIGHDRTAFRGSTAVQRSPRLQIVDFTSDAITYVRRPQQARRDDDTTLRVLVPRSGAFRVESAEQRLTLGPGSAAMVSMAAGFSISHDTGARGWVVSFPASNLPTAQDPRVPRTVDLRTGLGAVVGTLVRELSAERCALSEADFHDAATSLTALLVRSAVGSGSGNRGLLGAVTDVVRDHSDDPDLTPASLALRLGWSLRHVQAVVQDSGTTVSTLIRNARLARARLRLLDPSLDHLGIADLAHASGFGSISAFNAAYRDAYGTSPREARHR